MKKIYTLYIGIIFANLVSAQTKIDTVSFTLAPTESVYTRIESIKDSLITDSTLKTMRIFGTSCKSDHGGTFDIYECTLKMGRYERIHSYGSSMQDGTYNNDKYWKDGKQIAWIRVDYLENKSSEVKILVTIFMYG